MTRMVAACGAVIAFTLGATSLALAADLPVVPVYEPEPAPEFGGWYLRGHIGASNQQVDKLYNVLFDTTTVDVHKKDFKPAAIIGVGAGYQFNKWFRADVTGEHRFESNFRGSDTYNGPPWNFGANEYSGKKSEWLFLANAYVDLAYWNKLRPYVGVGIGASRNTFSNFVDINTVNIGGGGTAGTDSKWNFAWALYAGLGYDITPNVTFDLGYRFVHLGDARTKDIVGFGGVNNVNNPMHFRDITSHDILVSLRWSLSPRSYGYETDYAYDAGYETPYGPLVVKR